MIAVPHHLRPEGDYQVTGLACPDCQGVLQVRLAGRHEFLQFACRIGHTYSLQEIITAKEAVLEQRAWSTVLAAEEIAALHRDLLRDGRADADMRGRFETRRDGAQAFQEALRTALQRDRPVRLVGDDGEAAARRRADSRH